MFEYEVGDIDSGGLFLSVVKIREITNIKEKRKWMEYFIKAYSGPLLRLHPDMLGKFCRFFVASIDGKDAGFIRITNCTNDWSKYYSGEAWNAADAYVKKSYRSNGVLRQLLEYVVDHCNVVSVRMKTERLERYSRYYAALGFTNAWTICDGDLSIAVIDKFMDAVERRMDE